MTTTHDGIVIGTGVMGASCAMHLAAAGLKRLLVLEKAPGPGFGSTGRSVAIVRQTYSRQETTQMAHEALGLFRNWRDYTGLAEPKAGFNGCGVLFLLGRDDPGLAPVLAHHRKVGVASVLLDEQARKEAYPDLDWCGMPLDLEADSHDCEQSVQGLLETEGGFADPVGTAEDMLQVARNLGAQVRYNARVTGIEQQGGRVRAVTVSRGGATETMSAPVVVNCAGPWAVEINRMAGVPLPQRLIPTRIQVVTKGFPETLRGPLPVVADLVSGVYFRLEAGGGSIICGSLREEDEREPVANPDDYNTVADAPFRETTLTRLHHRVNTLVARGSVASYAGLYTVNQEDSHPIIDRSPLEGFFYVNGFSGHGFKLSPVVGTLLARKVVGAWGRQPSQVPEHFFDADRAPLQTNWGGVIA